MQLLCRPKWQRRKCRRTSSELPLQFLLALVQLCESAMFGAPLSDLFASILSAQRVRLPFSQYAMPIDEFSFGSGVEVLGALLLLLTEQGGT